MGDVLVVGINHYDGLFFDVIGHAYLYDFDNYTEAQNYLGEPGWVRYPGGRSLTWMDQNLDSYWSATKSSWPPGARP